MLEIVRNWPEQGQRPIRLCGVRGEIPLAHGQAKKPLVQKVPDGTAVVGYELWSSLALEKGDSITVFGKTLTVHELNPQQTSTDDITIIMPLADVQEIANQPGRINAIRAIKCFCAGSDIETIRSDIIKTLGDVQVHQLESAVKTRADARRLAAEAAAATIAQQKAAGEKSLALERQNREMLRQTRAAAAAWLVPLVVLGSMLSLAVLAVANARRRLIELALLRAVGMRTTQILGLLLVRAVLVGVIGAVLGCAVGYVAGVSLSELPTTIGETWLALLDPRVILAAILGAPILTALASWPPALWAAGRDPAVLLAAEV